MGPVKVWSEWALLRNEANKQTRHIPIRQLMQRAGRSVLAWKPCLMMSPLSVAQYLDPSCAPFDLVVMDEASQIRPEDSRADGNKRAAGGQSARRCDYSIPCAFNTLAGSDSAGSGFLGKVSRMIVHSRFSSV